MKKTIILLLLAVSVTTQAQFSVGVNSGYNRFSRNETTQNRCTYTLTPNLLLGYRINDHFTVGLTGSINYLCDDIQYHKEPDYWNGFDISRTQNILTWFAGAFTRYDIHLTEHLSLFAHLRFDFGKSFIRQRHERMAADYQNHDSGYTTILDFYDVTITPGISYRFNNHLSADFYLNLLNLSYFHGTYYSYYINKSNPGFVLEYPYSTFSFGSESAFAQAIYDYNNFIGQTIKSHSTFNIGINYTF